VKPGPDPWQRFPIHDDRTARPDSVRTQAEPLVSLSEAQRRLIAVLQDQRYGLTVRQLQACLSWDRGGLQELLDGLVERQLVGRLNTVVPSYIYRYGGVALDGD
jgi:hypothetical protein